MKFGIACIALLLAACGLDPAFSREYAFKADYQLNTECHPVGAGEVSIKVYDPDGTTFTQTPTKTIYLGNYNFTQTLHFFEDHDGSYSVFFHENIQRSDKRQNKQDGRYYPATNELRIYDPDRETVVTHDFSPDLKTWTGRTTIDTRICGAEEAHCDENCEYIWDISATLVSPASTSDLPYAIDPL